MSLANIALNIRAVFTQLSGFAFCTYWKNARKLCKVFWFFPSGVFLEFYLLFLAELISGSSLMAFAVLLNVDCFLHLFFLKTLRFPSHSKRNYYYFFLSAERRPRDSTARCSHSSSHSPYNTYQQEQIQVRRASKVIRHNLVFSQILWSVFPC